MDGVTDTRPPRNRHFTAYWEQRDKGGRRAPADIDRTPTAPGPAPPYHQFWGPGPGYPSYYPPPTETPTRHMLKRPSPSLPSSDPPEAVDQPSRYPTFIEFFARLHAVEENQPRNLPHWATIFAQRRFFRLNELKGWTTDELMLTFGLEEKGDANFIRLKVDAEMTRIDKESRRAKRARLE